MQYGKKAVDNGMGGAQKSINTRIEIESIALLRNLASQNLIITNKQDPDRKLKSIEQLWTLKNENEMKYWKWKNLAADTQRASLLVL